MTNNPTKADAVQQIEATIVSELRRQAPISGSEVEFDEEVSVAFVSGSFRVIEIAHAIAALSSSPDYQRGYTDGIEAAVRTAVFYTKAYGRANLLFLAQGRNIPAGHVAAYVAAIQIEKGLLALRTTPAAADQEPGPTYQFPGPCHRCGEHVEGGEVYFERTPSGGCVMHAACAPADQEVRDA